MITREELELTRECIDFARAEGASAVRITLTKSVENLVATLDGEIDKVTRCADRSMSIALFVDGRYGSFSINKLERESLQRFIREAIETVRMFAPDEYRRLPEPERCCRTAVSGMEMDLYDEAWADVTPEDRTRMALEACVTGRADDVRLVSEEGEYSDSEYDTYVIDSQGLECRHCETSFDYGVEVTIEDTDGNKYNDYWWTAATKLKDFDPAACGRTAISRAAAQIGARPVSSGRYNMVVSTEVASKLVSPLLNALNASSIQQGNSFLLDSCGKQVFSEGLNLVDDPWRKGESGSKLFDSEGVATVEGPIIQGGTVRHYFVNTYMSGKMGIDATTEDAARPRLCGWPSEGLDRNALMNMCGTGILVTDFNGGNCNMTTGDFSYGISGQYFENGKAVRPVHEMLITGNLLKLWNHLIAIGTDYRPCTIKLIGSLAFSDVDFSG